jgi:hypothetical protein
MERVPAAEAEKRLAALRLEIAQAAGFTEPAQKLLGASMDRLPREFFPSPAEEENPEELAAGVLPQLLGLSGADLRLNLQVLADQLSLREFEELLGPSRSQYSSVAEMPVEALRHLVATIAGRLAGRGVCDFIQRYRTGRFLAIPSLTGEVWSLLPQEERLRLLDQDNAVLDIAQMARHLAKILMTGDYQMLDDTKAQMANILSPHYQNLVGRLARLGDGDGEPKIVALNRAATRLVLDMEQSPREGRGGKLDRIRWLIGAAVGLTEQDVAALRA